MRNATFVIVLSVGVLIAAFGAQAQQPAPAQGAPKAAAAPAPKPPPVFLRETFKGTEVTPAVPLTNAQLLNPNLEVKLYGPGATAKPDHPSGLQLYNELDPLTGMDVSYVWSGMTEANWIFTLRDKANDVDLSGMGRIHWRARTRGFNTIHPVIKLADGTMLVGDFGQGESTYWHENEFFVGDVPRWRVFDEKEIVATKEGEWRTKVDLSRVSEIGVTDLSRGSGGGKGGNSGLDWIEVYGSPVKRGS